MIWFSSVDIFVVILWKSFDLLFSAKIDVLLLLILFSEVNVSVDIDGSLDGMICTLLLKFESNETLLSVISKLKTSAVLEFVDFNVGVDTCIIVIFVDVGVSDTLIDVEAEFNDGVWLLLCVETLRNFGSLKVREVCGLK